jgi:hypothetical protein
MEDGSNHFQEEEEMFLLKSECVSYHPSLIPSQQVMNLVSAWVLPNAVNNPTHLIKWIKFFNFNLLISYRVFRSFKKLLALPASE